MPRGLLEYLALPLFLLRPFRCNTCDKRYYGFLFSKRIRRNAKRVAEV
jgi:hypothetical protein